MGRRRFLFYFFLLVNLLTTNVLAISFTGCGLSDTPLCDKNEICVPDGLFGHCQHWSDSYVYYDYQLGSQALSDLRVILQALFDNGYQWQDTEAQDIIQEMIYPYRKYLIDPIPYPERVPTYDDEPSDNDFSQPGDESDPYQDLANDAIEDLLIQYLNDYIQEDTTALATELTDTIPPAQSNIEELASLTDDQLSDLLISIYDYISDTNPADIQPSSIETIEQLLTVGTTATEEPEYNEVNNEYNLVKKMSVQTPVPAEGWGQILTTTPTTSYQMKDNQKDNHEDLVGEIKNVLTGLRDDKIESESTISDGEIDELNQKLSDYLTEHGENIDYYNIAVVDEAPGISKPSEQNEANGRDHSSGSLHLDQMAADKSGRDPETTVKKADTSSNMYARPEVEIRAHDFVTEDPNPALTSAPENETPDKSGAIVIHNSEDVAQTLNGVNQNVAFLQTLKPATDIQAYELLQNLADILKVPMSTFQNISAEGTKIWFSVNSSNAKQLNATVVAQAAAANSNVLDKIGIMLTATGIGTPQREEVIGYAVTQDHTFIIITIVLVAIVFALLVLVVALYFWRRKAIEKEKLHELGDGSGETQPITAEYQDLCRQRMAVKGGDKPDPINTRVTSLSSEGQVNSPSSRSSTSSWSEEPAATNMDISTGHIILSYMEDHLKNKDRLTKEWEALCQYEAEPCSMSIGATPDNTEKNRYNDVLPYDHSRVELNDMTNASGSDYINASTITDHDPRNPAYIVTQGPIQGTVADFWQMIWEQGCTVIVMLTQLVENGASMCYRYWPEEGHDLYHIYEVHLVSEHIWCEDYLVRSFYLKNVNTNETRTVTQFHLLSWQEGTIPSSPKPLLEFRRKVNKSYRVRGSPIVVHCNDGVGRTGTYVLIDMVLNRMAKGAKEIDIAATLEHMRDQRALLLRNKEQFEFVLTAVADEVNAILKAMPQ